jgi:hypothetical protein
MVPKCSCQCLYCLFFNTQTRHIMKVNETQQLCIAMFSLKPGWIRTRVFCSWGGCYVDCTTPPGQLGYVTCKARPKLARLRTM